MKYINKTGCKLKCFLDFEQELRKYIHRNHNSKIELEIKNHLEDEQCLIVRYSPYLDFWLEEKNDIDGYWTCGSSILMNIKASRSIFDRKSLENLYLELTKLCIVHFGAKQWWNAKDKVSLQREVSTQNLYIIVQNKTNKIECYPCLCWLWLFF